MFEYFECASAVYFVEMAKQLKLSELFKKIIFLLLNLHNYLAYFDSLVFIPVLSSCHIIIYKNLLPFSIVSAETDAGGQVSAILEETVKVLVGEDDEEEDPTLSKPGVRRAKLQALMRAEMERQREVEWTKRQQEQRLYEEEVFEGLSLSRYVLFYNMFITIFLGFGKVATNLSL